MKRDANEGAGVQSGLAHKSKVTDNTPSNELILKKNQKPPKAYDESAPRGHKVRCYGQ